MASDFIERWQGENALRDSEQRLRMLADNLDERVRQRTLALEKAQDELSDLSAKLLVAQDEERRRIARELHDSAGQTLTILGLEIAQLSNSERTELSAKVAGLQEILQQLTEEVRTASYLLHPPLLDENGITAALKWYIEGLLARTKLNISLTISEDLGRLRRDVELVVFRVVQECLTNVIRHSESNEAFVSVMQKDGTLVIAVRDSGKGIPRGNIDQMQLKGFGVGIRGMRERVRQLGGTLNIESEGRGTTISVTLPVAAARSSRSQDTVQIVETAG
jgi:signal transduction histidine kinase